MCDSNSVDQAIKSDNGKPELMMNPWKIVLAINKIRTYAHKKYGNGADKWKEIEVERYFNALLRHTIAFAEDPKGLDEESGLPHIYHVACNVAFIIEMLYDDYEREIESHERNLNAIDKFTENIKMFKFDGEYIGEFTIAEPSDDIWHTFAPANEVLKNGEEISKEEK